MQENETSDPTPAAAPPELPSAEQLDEVAAEVQRVEEVLRLLDQKSSPMCAACTRAFVDASTTERLSLLQCTHDSAL